MIIGGCECLSDWRVQVVSHIRAIHSAMQANAKTVRFVDGRPYVGRNLAAAHQWIGEPCNKKIARRNVIAGKRLEVFTCDVTFFAMNEVSNPDVSQPKDRIPLGHDVVLCLQLAPKRAVAHCSVIWRRQGSKRRPSPPYWQAR